MMFLVGLNDSEPALKPELLKDDKREAINLCLKPHVQQLLTVPAEL